MISSKIGLLTNLFNINCCNTKKAQFKSYFEYFKTVEYLNIRINSNELYYNDLFLSHQSLLQF